MEKINNVAVVVTNKRLLLDIFLIILLVTTTATLTYGIIRLNSEGGQCVLNPIKYYEETYNRSLCQTCFGINSNLNKNPLLD